MTKLNYSELLKSPVWQKKRLEIMKRDKFKCKKCGDENQTLNVHHKKYINGAKPWEYENSELITLCQDCHSIVTGYSDLIGDNFDNAKIVKITGFADKNFRVVYLYSEYNLSTITIDNEETKCFTIDYDDSMALRKILK